MTSFGFWPSSAATNSYTLAGQKRVSGARYSANDVVSAHSCLSSLTRKCAGWSWLWLTPSQRKGYALSAHPFSFRKRILTHAGLPVKGRHGQSSRAILSTSFGCLGGM